MAHSTYQLHFLLFLLFFKTGFRLFIQLLRPIDVSCAESIRVPREHGVKIHTPAQQQNHAGLVFGCLSDRSVGRVLKPSSVDAWVIK